MKRAITLVPLGLAFVLFLGSTVAFSQIVFKIPFKFEAADKKFPPGNYWIEQKEEGKITLRKETGGEEILISIIDRLDPQDPPIEESQLVFDMVGNFEPSYTEYITDYMLAEVWLSGEDGFLVLSGERSEYRKTIKGAKEEKRPEQSLTTQ